VLVFRNDGVLVGWNGEFPSGTVGKSCGKFRPGDRDFCGWWDQLARLNLPWLRSNLNSPMSCGPYQMKKFVENGTVFGMRNDQPMRADGNMIATLETACHQG